MNFQPNHLFLKNFQSQLTLLLMLLILMSAPATAAEIDCKKRYRVSTGDTLTRIAAKAYNDSRKYNIIYYANNKRLTKGPSIIKIGQRLRIPCQEEIPAVLQAQAQEELDAQNNKLATNNSAATDKTDNQAVENQQATPSAASRPRVTELLTASDYRPFTDKALPGGGLVTELLETALKESGVNYRVNWINDWSAHLNPLLKEKKYDIGFPWLNPGCPQVQSPRCEFLFSKPVFEMLVVLFVRADEPLMFEQDSDIIGKKLCRPAGYYTHDLNKNDRNWLRDEKITLVQPDSVKACFDLLMTGEIDAVAINDFTGREAVSKQDLLEKVIPLERELSVEGLHALVHKTHPRATILINRINKGLAALHASARYDEVMDRHLLNHWKTVESAN